MYKVKKKRSICILPLHGKKEVLISKYRYAKIWLIKFTTKDKGDYYEKKENSKNHSN